MHRYPPYDVFSFKYKVGGLLGRLCRIGIELWSRQRGLCVGDL